MRARKTYVEASVESGMMRVIIQGDGTRWFRRLLKNEGFKVDLDGAYAHDNTMNRCKLVSAVNQCLKAAPPEAIKYPPNFQ